MEKIILISETSSAPVNGGGIMMLHRKRPVGRVAAAQNCVSDAPLSVWSGAGDVWGGGLRSGTACGCRGGSEPFRGRSAVRDRPSHGEEDAELFGAAGELVRGERSIDEAEAEIVRRIFREFARGTSPRAIARRVNEDGIPGPKAGCGPTPCCAATPNAAPGCSTTSFISAGGCGTASAS